MQRRRESLGRVVSRESGYNADCPGSPVVCGSVEPVPSVPTDAEQAIVLSPGHDDVRVPRVDGYCGLDLLALSRVVACGDVDVLANLGHCVGWHYSDHQYECDDWKCESASQLCCAKSSESVMIRISIVAYQPIALRNSSFGESNSLSTNSNASFKRSTVNCTLSGSAVCSPCAMPAITICEPSEIGWETGVTVLSIVKAGPRVRKDKTAARFFPQSLALYPSDNVILNPGVMGTSRNLGRNSPLEFDSLC